MSDFEKILSILDSFPCDSLAIRGGMVLSEFHQVKSLPELHGELREVGLKIRETSIEPDRVIGEVTLLEL